MTTKMKKIKLSPNSPIPEITRKVKAKIKEAPDKYDFKSLRIGDGGLFFPGAAVKTVSSAAIMRRKNKDPNFYVTCRTMTHDGVKGVGVFRISKKEWENKKSKESRATS